MKTIHLQIEDNKVDVFLNIVKNLKDGIVKNYCLADDIDENLQLDPFFYERQKELHQLRDDIKLGKMKMYDFNDSMDELISELEA